MRNYRSLSFIKIARSADDEEINLGDMYCLCNTVRIYVKNCMHKKVQYMITLGRECSVFNLNNIFYHGKHKWIGQQALRILVLSMELSFLFTMRHWYQIAVKHQLKQLVVFCCCYHLYPLFIFFSGNSTCKKPLPTSVSPPQSQSRDQAHQ